tara:strand:- start:3277 stop:3462 length:186 start_codon:yes stop_codon:yes gene_type:complete
MPNCIICNKPLKKIGLGRKNGRPIANKTGYDWKERTKHKKCWKEEKLQELIKSLAKDVKMT